MLLSSDSEQIDSIIAQATRSGSPPHTTVQNYLRVGSAEPIPYIIYDDKLKLPGVNLAGRPVQAFVHLTNDGYRDRSAKSLYVVAPDLISPDNPLARNPKSVAFILEMLVQAEEAALDSGIYVARGRVAAERSVSRLVPFVLRPTYDELCHTQIDATLELIALDGHEPVESKELVMSGLIYALNDFRQAA